MTRCSSLSLAVVLFLGLAASSRADERLVEIRNPAIDLSFGRHWGFDLVRMKGAGMISVPGAPAVPEKQIHVALPSGAAKISLAVKERESVVLSSSYDLLPVPAPASFEGAGKGFPFQKDLAVYKRHGKFPGRDAEILEKWDLWGQEFVTLVIYPLQYDPRERSLELTKRLVLEVSWKDQPPSKGISFCPGPGVQERLERMARSLAWNPEDVRIPSRRGPSRTGPLDGGPEYVVISPDHWEQGWDDLVDWKTRKGVPAKVVTLGYIYAQYPGSSEEEKIRSFIQDAHAAWGTAWFLLGGDSSLIPYKETYLLGDSIPNDTFYGDFDDDDKVEVFVGRASADHSLERDRFIQKTLSYERAPPAGFGGSAFFFAFDLDPYTRTEELMQDIENLYLPSAMQLSSEYDSEPGTHKADCLSYLDGGCNLINHGDHCDYNRIGAGHSMHGQDLSIQDILGLENQDRYSVVKSIGCYTCAFDYNDCIAEHMCKAQGGGAAAFVGNTRYGWYSPGSVEDYSFKYDRLFFKALLKDGCFHVGEALAACRNAFTPTDDYYKYIFKELVLLGDPELPVWTGDPEVLDTTHAKKIVIGGQAFTLNVSSGGAPKEGALCCLWKGEEVYSRGETDASGEADLFIDPLSAGTLLVTVIAENHVPYEGATEVLTDWPCPEIDEVIPRCGKESGGTLITIQGANFTSGGTMTVRIDGNLCSGVNVVSPEKLTCLTPPGSNGYKEIQVTSSLGSGSLYPAFRYFPLGGLPFNGTDVPPEGLCPSMEATLIASGMPSHPFMVFISAGGGPSKTPWGFMGLGAPVSFIFCSCLNLEGFALLPFQLPEASSSEFYLHILGVDPAGFPRWSEGGENPNGTGSIFFKW